MRRVGVRKEGEQSAVTVYERNREDDGEDSLICLCQTSRTPVHTRGGNVHFEREDAQRFLYHLYDHRLNNEPVYQDVIDELWKRLKQSRRYAAAGR